MESPSGIVKALFHICANRNANFLSLFISISPIIHTFYLWKKTRKFPFLIPVTCRVADHGAEIISAMILYEISTYPQRGKQPSRPKPQTSWCTQMLSAVNLIRRGLCLVLQTQEAETSSAPRVAARSARCVCFERAGHTGSELVSSWLLTSRLMWNHNETPTTPT